MGFNSGFKGLRYKMHCSEVYPRTGHEDPEEE
jgi:hypothetical protein